MISVRTILSFYRRLQYKLCGRHHLAVMESGVMCSHDPFEEDINHGDVVHPCVRYIPEGYEGHCWWMVYTPYYAANDKTENPILCYAESNEPAPPTHWKVYCQVQSQPEKGYNSDPVLFYSQNTLFVYWRENETIRCENDGCFRATYGGKVVGGHVVDIFGPVVGTTDSEYDPQTSPTFIQEPDGTYRCLSISLTFHSKAIQRMPKRIKGFVSRMLLVLDLMGLWSQQKHHGIAQWSSKTIDGSFKFDKIVKFRNKNPLYRPWHMDLFEWGGKLYAIVQTNQCNADLCLAVSEDRINFRFFDKPLMTNETCKKVGIYKPTAGVIDGTLYLYYTAQDIDNRSLNKLYLTKSVFSDILNKVSE